MSEKNEKSFFLCFSIFKSNQNSSKIRTTSKLAALMICISMISFLYTIIQGGSENGAIYFLVLLCWSILSIAACGFEYKSSPEKLARIVAACIVTLSIFALLQQLNINTALPGISWHFEGIRPSSTTGSYLHYPIIMVFLSTICFQLADFTNKKTYYAFGIFGIVIVLFAYSRSGFLMSALFVFYILFRSALRDKSKAIKLFAASIFIIIISLILFPAEVLDRALSTLDTSSSGNNLRVGIWKTALSSVNFDTALIGGMFGAVTNSSSNISGATTFVVESSLLQQIYNIGIPGAIIFYFIMFTCHSSISNRHIYLKAISFSFIIQSLVYQSIEVFPAIALFTFLPILSSILSHSENFARKTQSRRSRIEQAPENQKHTSVFRT